VDESRARASSASDALKVASRPGEAGWGLFLAVAIGVGALFPLGGQASCYPQCVAYAREQSGIYTERVGPARGAIHWFERAALAGATQVHPGEGFVGLALVLGPQPGINRRFGHVVFVEYSESVADGRAYVLHLSHANFDGRCTVESANAYYFPAAREIDVINGFFAGRTFSVEGFINR